MRIIRIYTLLLCIFHCPCKAQEVGEWNHICGRKDIDEILYRVEAYEEIKTYAVRVYRDARGQGIQGDKKPFATRYVTLRFNKSNVTQLLKILPLKKQDGVIRFDDNKALVGTLKWDGKNWSYNLWTKKGGWEIEVKEFRVKLSDKELMGLLKALEKRGGS